MKQNQIIIAALAVILLVGLFLFFRSKSTTYNPPVESSPAATSSAQTKTFELVVKSRKLVSGPDTITVTQGDNVTIRITSNEEEELHLHGYDKSVDLQKDVPADLTFTADITGRFVYELEKSKTEIGALEVQPK